MPDKTFYTRIKHKIDTSAHWNSNDSVVLADGELGFERTLTGDIKIKIGNGTDTWSQLPYVSTGGASGSDEIFVGTNEPEGYRMWIDPTGDVSGVLESIPISYIDFTLTTINDEEVLTTEYDFDDVETEVEAESVVIARITTDDSILYAQLLERKDIGETPLDTFLFGVATNDSYKIFTINENDICAVSTMSLGGGTGFELEENGNILLDNGILKARYGELSTSIETLYTIDENSETNGPNTYLDFGSNEDVGLNSFMLYNLNQSIPVITPEEGEYIEAILTISYSDNTTREINMEIGYDDEWLGIPVGYAGDPNLGQYMDLDEESEEYNDFVSYVQSHPTSYLFTNLQSEEDGLLINQVICILPIAYATSSNGNGELNAITLSAEITVGYPLPAAALRAGNGISINPTTGAIGIKYGEKKKDLNVQKYTFDSNNQPSSPVMGQLYGWYAQYNNFSSWEPSELPSSFQNINNLTMNYYKDGELDYSGSYENVRTTNYQYTIDYNEDSYRTFSFYYIEEDNINNSSLDDYLVELKELPYNNNLLYTMASDALDPVNTECNIFYAGTYNTSDSVNTILTNYSITPTDNTKPAILFVLLDEPYGQPFFWTFSNENDLDLDDKGGLIFTQLRSYQTYNNMPFSVFNKDNILRPGYSQIVSGHYNDLSDNSSDCLILGADDKTFNNNTALYINTGYYSTPQLNIHGNTIELNGNVRVNGSELSGSNSSSVASYIDSGDSNNPVSGSAVANYCSNFVQKSSLLNQIQNGYTPQYQSTTIYPIDYISYSVYDEYGSVSFYSSDGTYGDSDYINISGVGQNENFTIDNFVGGYTDYKVYGFDESYNYEETLTGTFDKDSTYQFTKTSKNTVYIKFVVPDTGSIINYNTQVPFYQDIIQESHLPKMTYISTANNSIDTTNTTLKEVASNYNTLAQKFNNLLNYLQSAGYMNYTS